MILESFLIGVAFSKDIAFSEAKVRSVVSNIINAVANEGNFYFCNVFESCAIARSHLITKFGMFTSSRHVKIPIKEIYTEQRHINYLNKIQLNNIIYFSETLPNEKKGNVFVINISDYTTKIKDLFEKKDAFQIRQDYLPHAIENSSALKGIHVKIRDPYLNERFLARLLKTEFFKQGKLEYHFSIIPMLNEEEKQQDLFLRKTKTYIEYKTTVFQLVEQKIKNLFQLFDESLKRNLETQISIYNLRNSNKLRFFFYFLKEEHIGKLLTIWDDRSAHWHHRFISFEQNGNTANFESSHSFIYRPSERHYAKTIEHLHFRFALEKEFESFKAAFCDPLELRI